jgi:hypothetical protein
LGGGRGESIDLLLEWCGCKGVIEGVKGDIVLSHLIILISSINNNTWQHLT